jgi:ribosomal protein L5
MKLTLFKKGDFNEVKDKVLRHSGGDIVFQFVQDGDEIYINIHVRKEYFYNVLKQLYEIYEINIHNYKAQNKRGDVE